MNLPLFLIEAPRLVKIVCVCALALGPAASVLADPPPWAPAHGYRAKHGKHKYDHYAVEHRYFGVLDGHCRHEEIGTVLGGAIGGAVGRHAAGDGDRTAGTIAGVIIGALLGNAVGRSMDGSDRYCTGHVLEYAPDRSTVTWRNPHSDLRYSVIPMYTREDGDRYCREYLVRTERRGRVTEEHGYACRNTYGQWRMD
jgi:surface antigen